MNGEKAKKKTHFQVSFLAIFTGHFWGDYVFYVFEMQKKRERARERILPSAASLSKLLPGPVLGEAEARS